MPLKIKQSAVQLCLAIFLLFITSFAFSQTRTITGKVVGPDNAPVVGASVTVNGTNSGTSTDANGSFSISVPTGKNALTVSSVGFETQTLPLSSSNTVTAALKTAASNLNEIVVTGYTSQRKKDVTGSVSVVNVEEMNKQPTGQVANQLQGQAAGVTVIGSGQPGEEPQIRIRGINTFGNNTPLFVIDGVPTQNISTLNPNDIASMQVLKDAGASSIYGSRASNGVVIITTKTGKSGKTVVTYDGYYGTQVPKSGNVYNILTPQEMAQLKFNALANSGTPVTTVKPDALYGGGATPVLPDYIYPTGAMEGDPSVDLSKYNVNPNYSTPAELNNFYRIVRANKTGTDYFHEIFKSAPTQSHNIAVSGGNEKGRYLMSLNYTNQQGTLINTYFKRYTLRANTQFTIAKGIKVGENLAYSIVDNPRIGALSEGSAIGMAFRQQPIIPVYDIMGNYAGSSGPGLGNARNPVAIEQRMRDNKGYGNRLFGNVYADVDFLRNFTFHTSFGGESYSGFSRSFTYPEYENSENNSVNAYTENTNYGFNWTWTNTLNFRKTFNSIHTVSVLVGTEAYNANGYNNSANTQGYFSFDPNYTTLNTGSGTMSHTSGRSTQGLWSQFGRLDYSFKDRYLLSGTIRRDGSSLFVDNQYGIFPAVTAAWRISEEEFMKDISWIKDLKIRAGWGVMGNQLNVNPTNGFYTYVSDRSSSYYDIAGTNNSLQSGLQVGQIPNPSAKWEKDVNSNIGIDATLFKGVVDITADYYKKDIQDLLFNPTYPGTAGTGTVPFSNVAQVKNHGIDLALGLHTNITHDLKLNATATFTNYHNEVTKVADNQSFFFSGGQRRFGTNFVRNEVGHPIGAFYGYKIIGFWNDEAEIAAADQAAQKSTGNGGTTYQTAEGVGRFRYADVNGDGIITAADRTFIGNPNPKFTYGLNIALDYKNLDFSMFLYGSQGADIWNNVRYWTDFYPSFAGAKSKTALYNSWTPTNHNAKAPIQENAGTFSTNGTASSYYIENGSYLRAKNVTLGYTFPKSLLGRYGFSSFRVYVQAANLFTITKYSGLDPEINGNGVTEFGIDEGSYPSQRQYLLGVNLKF
ncbi:SusC/RagA family TonB-linked outer membrane protein [Segetibacter koreensis]|uniref:SusC/RagA family TonB-linked outer membrane protein n=1 Tax=Segetibacter koreensis TaxID=398037 RepID=UPI00036C8B56|nr:TonB-dependent receptor [Segetibacter koreensis]